MECANCGNNIQLRKNLQQGKSALPGECPECGSELEKSGGDGGLIMK